MCGRYYVTSPPAAIIERFGLEDADAQLELGVNIAPTQRVGIITNEQPRRLTAARWGLVPFWADDIRIGARLFNARAETAHEKPAFRQAFRRRRCLVPADGFYEWRELPTGRKQPVRFALRSGDMLAFAGLWDVWKPPEGPPLISCTILTTDANALVMPVHNRMPVVLPREAEQEWLAEATEEELRALLAPIPAELMVAEEVDPALLRGPRARTESA